MQDLPWGHRSPLSCLGISAAIDIFGAEPHISSTDHLHMKPKSLILLLAGVYLLGLLACRSESEEPTTSYELTEQQRIAIDSICRSFLAKGNTVGFSLGLAHHGQVLFAQGYGLANIEGQKPATENTIYPIASISKFITGITTLRLVEDGRLSLEDKVVDLLEGFPQQQYMEEITVEHLLRHQSGLVDHEDWFDSLYIHEKRVFTTTEFYDFLDRPLFFRPGSQYSYSNSGYALLSAILEKTTQKSFHELIVAEIGSPLGLRSLGMWPEQWQRPEASLGYELNTGGLDTSFHMMTQGMKGDGGLSASVADLLKIGTALADGTLLPASALERMLSPTPIGPIAIDYGLGVKSGNYHGQPCWGHSGGYKGTGWALLAHYPESGITFAAAMNTNYSPEEMWMLRHLIMPVVLQIDRPSYEARAVDRPERFAGEYAAIDRWGGKEPSTRVATAQEGGLFWDNPDTDTPPAPLFQTGENTFSWQAFPFDEFRFHEVDGKIVACSEYYDGLFGMVRMKQEQADHGR